MSILLALIATFVLSGFRILSKKQLSCTSIVNNPFEVEGF